MDMYESTSSSEALKSCRIVRHGPCAEEVEAEKG